LNEVTDASCEAPTPYVPEANFGICDPFKSLRHLVDSLRICGFTKLYAVKIMRTMFPIPPKHRLPDHTYNVAPSTAWPPLPGQKAFVDDGRGGFSLEQFAATATTGASGSSRQMWGVEMPPLPGSGKPWPPLTGGENGGEADDEVVKPAPFWKRGDGDEKAGKAKRGLRKRLSWTRLRRSGSM
jgi:hypothetical protein